ncbi:MAG: hypothetical protein MJD61_17705, partial [Proteobacteria bacterium]|nr:hypothetical protein [Pseudomonadota bacterium]
MQQLEVLDRGARVQSRRRDPPQIGKRRGLVVRWLREAARLLLFPNQGDGRWQHRLRLKKSPPYALEAPGVRLIDIDGDGLVDVMRTSA